MHHARTLPSRVRFGLASLALLGAAVAAPAARAQTLYVGDTTRLANLPAGNGPEWYAPAIAVSDVTGQNGGIGGYPGGSGFAPPGGTTNPPVGQNNPRYATPYGTGYDGVARLLMRDNTGAVATGCTGTLLWTGFDILTAAHCVSTGTGTITTTGVDVGFLNQQGGVTTIQSSAIIVKPGYDGAVVQPNDLAIVRLSRQADPWMTRYSLYDGNPLNQTSIIAGYGLSGSGLTGGIVSTLFNAVPVRRMAQNRFEFTVGNAFDGTTNFISLDPRFSGILQQDFDGSRAAGSYPVRGTFGAQSADLLNRNCVAWGVSPLQAGPNYNPAGLTPDEIAQVCDLGVPNLMEGIIGSGDSGGPAFIMSNGQLMVAGVASFGAQRCVPHQATPPRTDPGCPAGFILNGSYFGATTGHVSVSSASGDAGGYFWVQQNVVPEPGTLGLAAVGALGVLAAARRRRA